MQNIECLMIKIDTGENPAERRKDGIEVTLAIGDRKGASKFSGGHSEKFLDDLITDTTRVFGQCGFDQPVGYLLFRRLCMIKGIDKNIGVEKVVIVHSIRPW